MLWRLIQSSWQGSSIQKGVWGLFIAVSYSWTREGFLHFLQKASLFFEQSGGWLHTKRWQLPTSMGLFLVGWAATTLAVRFGIIQIFGSADGRLLIPPGLCLVWLAVGTSQVANKQPHLWRASWTFRILSKCHLAGSHSPDGI